MEHEDLNLDIKDYVDVIVRRKYHFAISALVAFSIGAALAYLLPPVYQSTATILIEEQEIPDDLVRSTVTSYAAERIERISQQILKGESLLKIAEKYDLYPEYRDAGLTQMAASEMKEHITKQLVSAEVADPRASHGKAGEATIAFTLSFESDQPKVAQQVTQELAGLFLQENVKERMRAAEETTGFLSAEAEALSHQISNMEADIARFKEKHADYLPELSSLTLQLLTRTESEIAALDSKIQSQLERKIILEGNLSQLDPHQGMISSTGQRILTPSEQLKANQVELLRLSSIYSPEHPNIVRLMNEIKTLEKTVGVTDTTVETARQLAQLRADLMEKEQKFSQDHPDVVQLKRSIAGLEQVVSELASKPPIATDTTPPDNPAYINIKTQLLAIDSDIHGMELQKASLKAKLVEYEQRLARMPQVEQDYQVLQRDYEHSKDRYRDIKDKLLQAKIAQTLEEKGKGEHFSIVENAGFPQQPIKPNRLGILLLGAVIAIATGVAVAFVAEFADGAVYREKQITRLLGEPPLALVPYIEDSQVVVDKQKIKMSLFLVIAVAAILAWLILNQFLSAE